MLKDLLVLSVVSTLCYGLDVGDASGYNFLPQLHGCLKLHQQPADWLQSWSICLREGAQLASPWTQHFVSAIKELQTRHGQLPVLFSGAHVTLPPYNGGAFLSMGQKEWKLCGVWYASGTTGSVDCKKQLPFVCFATPSAASSNPTCIPVLVPTPAPPPAPTTTPVPPPTTTPLPPPTFTPDPSCGEETLGYLFTDELGGRCFKFHGELTNWKDANRTCVEEGALLPVPDTREKTRVLTAFFARYPSEDGSWFKNCLAVGIYWESNEWKTVGNGQTLNQSDLPEWMQDQPSAMHLHPHVYLYRDSRLNNWAIPKTPFICEKAPVRA